MQWGNTVTEKTGQAGLEAAFQVPMPGDSGSSPEAGSISNYCLTQEIYHSNPSWLLSFNKSEKSALDYRKILLLILNMLKKNYCPL